MQKHETTLSKNLKIYRYWWKLKITVLKMLTNIVSGFVLQITGRRVGLLVISYNGNYFKLTLTRYIVSADLSLTDVILRIQLVVLFVCNMESNAVLYNWLSGRKYLEITKIFNICMYRHNNRTGCCQNGNVIMNFISLRFIF